MARTTFNSVVRSRGGGREDDGVSTGGMLMSVLVSTDAGVNRALKIGGDPESGEDVVLPKGAVVVSFQKLSAADAGASILAGSPDDPNGIFSLMNLAAAVNALYYPNGALVSAASYYTGGLSSDTAIITTNGATPPTVPVVGILTYFVFDDGTSETR